MDEPKKLRPLSSMTMEESVEIGVYHLWHLFTPDLPNEWRIQFYMLKHVKKMMEMGFDVFENV